LRPVNYSLKVSCSLLYFSGGIILVEVLMSSGAPNANESSIFSEVLV